MDVTSETYGVDYFNIAQVDALPVKAAQLGQVTCRDSVLSKVLHFTKSGWPQNCLKP